MRSFVNSLESVELNIMCAHFKCRMIVIVIVRLGGGGGGGGGGT